jgi:ribokinase
VSAVTIDETAATGVALILLEQGGHNRIVVMSGANNRLDEREVSAARVLLEETDVLLMQLEIPFPVVAAVGQAARELGVMSVLDAGPATKAAAEAGILELMDIVSPNESETEVLTGMAVRSPDDAARASTRFRELGVRDVVIKLGPQGAYWQGTEGDQHIPGFSIEPVDTTAAGDAFTACLSVGLAVRLPLPEAIRRANAAGALACLKLGAQPSMPTRQELESFLRARA